MQDILSRWELMEGIENIEKRLYTLYQNSKNSEIPKEYQEQEKEQAKLLARKLNRYSKELWNNYHTLYTLKRTTRNVLGELIEENTTND